MKTTKKIHDLGQSLWLDNITRELLTGGTLERYIKELSVTGLTSNPTIFEHAIQQGDIYDDAIQLKYHEGQSTESLFFELALDDLRQAADLFHPVHVATGGLDGWVSLEVSPQLVDDTQATIQAALHLHSHANRSNLLIKIPGTPAGIPAIEEAIFAGIPVNITLLFSRNHYLDAANAYMSAIERRISAGLNPKVASVASVFISRWDVAVKDKLHGELRSSSLGIAVAIQIYKTYRELLASARWQKLAAAGVLPQRLLWASTGTKDSSAPDTIYVDALVAPDTINTIPERTLLALASHSNTASTLTKDQAYAEKVFADFTRNGICINTLALKLQREGVESFSKSWDNLLNHIEVKIEKLSQKK
jgi:transaldolase